MTAGWKILVKFADCYTSWLPLKDVKEGSPVELAEYAMLNKSTVNLPSTGGYTMSSGGVTKLFVR